MDDSAAVEICIVGAGPVGASLACRLASAGVPTLLVDRSPLPPMEHPDFDGRAYAIAVGSQPVLAEAGVWQRLPIEPHPIRRIRVSDGRIGRPAAPLFLQFDAAEVAEAAGELPAALGHMVEARSLRMALNARLHGLAALTLRAPAEAAVERTEAGVRVEVGAERFACRLVVAAEGRESALRRAAAIPVTRLPYRQAGIVCAIAHERPHHDTALEHFLPAGPFAQLPMGGNAVAPHISAIVWTEASDRAERLVALDPPEFGAEIGRRLGDHLGGVRPIGRRWLYPLGALHAHRYTATRLALVGDAAHGIHPIAGQGLNLGLRDVAALAELLIEAHARGADPGDPALLARYQAARRPDNLAMLIATDMLDRLFSNDNRVLRVARDLGIAGVNRLPPLKRLFMRQAMGLPLSG